jgi:alkylation response protein AidB-like acyl-CoA dehydrogenase
MDFTFSPDQEALRDAVRAFLGSEAPMDYVRRMAEHDDAGITPEVWRKIVDLGWTGLLAPDGGRTRPGTSTRSSCKRRWGAVSAFFVGDLATLVAARSA